MGQSASVPPMETTSPSGGIADDYTSALPDDCLALIFQSLSAGNRNQCSLVSKRWLIIDARTRRHLSLDANPELAPHIPSLFSRFHSVTHLTLRCPRDSPSITDADLLTLSLRCPGLSSLKLIGCRGVSDLGISSLARTSKNLTALSCSSCSFGIKGFNAVFHHCCLLQHLSISYLPHGSSELDEPIGSSESLKSICLKEVDSGDLFAPLIIGATNLIKLELVSCVGDWDVVLESAVNSNDRLVEIRLENLPQVSDAAFSAISNCATLELLEVLNIPNCTNLGIVSVAERCKHSRQLHIRCRGPNRIGDEGLAAVGRNCINLQQLVLMGANPTIVSLEVIASSCPNLELLALGDCENLRDSELSFLAGKCKALTTLMIMSCPISDAGFTSLFWGFPNLENVMLLECIEVSRDILHWLKMQRQSLLIWLDSDEIELVEANTSDGARAQGSIWNVMILWYFLHRTTYKANNPH